MKPLVQTAITLAFAAGFAALPARAEEGRVVTYDFPEERISANSCWFVEETVRTVVGGDNEYRNIAADLRGAEAPIRQYVLASLSNSEDATAMAFRDFSAWYARRIEEQNQRELAERRIAEIVGTVLDEALPYAFPGSGMLASAIRSASSTAYDRMMGDTTSAGNESPQAYLDAVAGQLEDSDARMRMYSRALFHDTDNRALMDQVETIKFEYVMERRAAERQASSAMTRLTPDTCTGQLLEDMGIRRPTPPNAAAIRHRVLSDLIEKVLCETSFASGGIASCQSHPRAVRQVAESSARRLILVGRANVAQMYNLTEPAHLEAVCHYESTAPLWDSPDCRAWRSQNR